MKLPKLLYNCPLYVSTFCLLKLYFFKVSEPMEPRFNKQMPALSRDVFPCSLTKTLMLISPSNLDCYMTFHLYSSSSSTWRKSSMSVHLLMYVKVRVASSTSSNNPLLFIQNARLISPIGSHITTSKDCRSLL
jgi:hypothetical protein